MQAVEFETDVENGMIPIPEAYREIGNARVRVVVMYEEEAAYLESDRFRKDRQEVRESEKAFLADESQGRELGEFMDELREGVQDRAS